MGSASDEMMGQRMDQSSGVRRGNSERLYCGSGDGGTGSVDQRIMHINQASRQIDRTTSDNDERNYGFHRGRFPRSHSNRLMRGHNRNCRGNRSQRQRQGNQQNIRFGAPDRQL